VSIPYSPSRRRQWVGIAVAALLFAPLFWKHKPPVKPDAPLVANNSTSSFEDVIRTTSPSPMAAAAPALDEAAAPPARAPE